jgi:UDP-3-O-[3-hydroxymyristoyl] N-acetylglucosamine deacetylase
VCSEVTVSGTGLFTGEAVSLTLCPAPPHSGIVFQRVDLPGKPEIPASLDYVRHAPRTTRLSKDGADVFMVEHILSALFALGVDNARIEIAGSEIPSFDGSSKPFVDLLEKAGLKIQMAPRQFLRIEQPLYWSEGDVHLVALPAEETRFSYTLHYPNVSLLQAQYFSFLLKSDSYKIEIAPCRTFAVYEELFPLIEKGILKGGGLESGVVIQDNRILNREGVRFENEMVRHKILDLIGDLSLLGKVLLAHVIAIRSGHASNVAFAKVLHEQRVLQHV